MAGRRSVARRSPQLAAQIARTTVLVALLAAASPARAGGGVIPEIGTRKTAMGAMIGRPDDLSALYHNPAGLILSQGTNLYLNAGLSLLDLSIKLRPWSGSERYLDAPVGADGYYPGIQPSVAYGVIPMLVASTNLWSDDLVAAIGVYCPNAVGAAFDDDSVARFHVIDSYVVAGAATFAVAYRPWPQLTLGLGGNLVYVQAKSRRNLFPVINGLDLGPVFGGDSVLELEGNDVSGGATLGLLWQPLPFLSAGLAVITPTDVTLEGDVEVQVGQDALVGRGQTISGTHRTGIFLPWTIQAGLNIDLTSWLEVGAEWRYYVYRDLDEQRSTIGGDLGQIVDELVVPKNSSDSIHISGGLKLQPPHRLLEGLEVMLGVHYDESPAPDNTVGVDQPTFTHVGLHSGLRYRIDHRFRVAATYVHYWYLERSTNTSLLGPPANYVAGGANNIFTLVLEARVGGGIGM